MNINRLDTDLTPAGFHSSYTSDHLRPDSDHAARYPTASRCPLLDPPCVKYIGQVTIWDGERNVLIEPGMVGRVVSLQNGWHGSGQVLDWDLDTGDPYYDNTHNHRSVTEFPGGYSRSVSAESADYVATETNPPLATFRQWRNECRADFDFHRGATNEARRVKCRLCRRPIERGQGGQVSGIDG